MFFVVHCTLRVMSVGAVGGVLITVVLVSANFLHCTRPQQIFCIAVSVPNVNAHNSPYCVILATFSCLLTWYVQAFADTTSDRRCAANEAVGAIPPLDQAAPWAAFFVEVRDMHLRAHPQ
jgi:hypothetical protein